MTISVTGRHVEISDAFRAHVASAVQGVNDQHHITPQEVQILLSKQGVFFKSELSVQLERGMVLRAQGAGEDGYSSFDAALQTMIQSLRKHKKRMRDYHQHADHHAPSDQTPYYVLNGASEAQEETGDAPAIIAEMQKEIRTMTVGDAVMHMELGSENAYIFRNKMNGGINVLYRRADGNIGWVDPSLKKE